MNECEILKEWNAYIWGFLYRIPLSDPALSPEDFYAPAALALLDAHASWDPEGGASLRAWIGRHIGWAIKDALKREAHSRWKRVPIFVPLPDEGEEGESVLISPSPAPELSILALPYVESALRTLPPSHARALRARYFEGLTLAEAASRRGVSRQAESNVVQEALKRIRVRFGVVGEL